MIVNASGLDCGSFTITGSDGVVYAQNQSVNTILPTGITVTLTIVPKTNCTFSGSYQHHHSTTVMTLSSSQTTYNLSGGDVTLDLAFEKLPVLTMDVTPKNLGSGYWTVTDGAGHSYTNGSSIPVPGGDIGSPDDTLTLTLTPGSYGCNGSIDNNGAVTQIHDGRTSYSFTATGAVTIAIDYYSRNDYYTIHFYDGDTLLSSQRADASGTAGKAVNVELNPYTNTRSNIFNGWNTVAAPTAENPGTAYADSATISLTGDLALYAQWISAYAVTF